MEAACPRTSYPVTLGCAIKLEGGKACIVFIAEDYILHRTPWTYHILFRHEQGHCQFWGGDHKGARPATPENIRNYDHNRTAPIPNTKVEAISGDARVKILPVIPLTRAPFEEEETISGSESTDEFDGAGDDDLTEE
jgi:hypothetical protein